MNRECKPNPLIEFRSQFSFWIVEFFEKLFQLKFEFMNWWEYSWKWFIYFHFSSAKTVFLFNWYWILAGVPVWFCILNIVHEYAYIMCNIINSIMKLDIVIREKIEYIPLFWGQIFQIKWNLYTSNDMIWVRWYFFLGSFSTNNYSTAGRNQWLGDRQGNIPGTINKTIQVVFHWYSSSSSCRYFRTRKQTDKYCWLNEGKHK